MSFNLARHWDVEEDYLGFVDHFIYLKNAEQSFDIVQSAADFYLCFAICNKSLVQFPKINLVHPDMIDNAAKILKVSDREIRERNDRYYHYIHNSPAVKLQNVINNYGDFFNELVLDLDNLFIDYISAAIGGELRHHHGVTCLGKGGAHEGRYIAWSRWGNIHKVYGDSIFTEAKELFLDFPDGSYGGKPWANAAQLLIDRKNCRLGGSIMENKTIFIDRVFNMQHNTGSFLNKLSWANFRTNNGDFDGLHNMHETVLKAHSSNPPDLEVLVAKARDEVKSAVIDTINIARDNNINIHGIYRSKEKA